MILCLTLISCQKGKGPCFDNNTGILVVKNTSALTVHIWVDNIDKGYFASGISYSGEAITGSHVVYAEDNSGNWPNTVVTVNQCQTYTLTLHH